MNMRTPALNALKMFDCAARHLNFRLAAEELNLTQGAVAQQVRKLESELSVKLFHRRARGLELTSMGLEYYLQISQALKIIDQATNKLRPENRAISISATPSLASKWLVKKLALFSKSYPDIQVSTHAGENLADFSTDGIALAIRQGSPPFEEGLEYHLLTHENLCAVCHPEYALSIGEISEVDDFAPLDLIEDSHKNWHKLFHGCSIDTPSGMIHFNQSALAIEAAANGQGIAIVPKILVEDYLSQEKLEIIWHDNRDNPVGYYLVYPAGTSPNSEVLKIVLKWLLSATSKSS
ncbi:MAG: LysR family transcriptional regulator [Gammaproteobacteria bacterium]|nr:LysR family transcriptional regulator [Gammaproteobacteria bacterium]